LFRLSHHDDLCNSTIAAPKCPAVEKIISFYIVERVPSDAYCGCYFTILEFRLNQNWDIPGGQVSSRCEKREPLFPSQSLQNRETGRKGVELCTTIENA